jgi:Tfp pilus assembly protein FimT
MKFTAKLVKIAFLTIMLSVFLNTNTGFAKEVENLSNTTFQVTEFLSLGQTIDENGQAVTQENQRYFSDPNNSPIVSFVIYVINFATAVIGTIAVIVLIAAGLIMVTSNGDETRISEAKDAIKYAIMGLVFAFLSFVVVTWIQNIFAIQVT